VGWDENERLLVKVTLRVGKELKTFPAEVVYVNGTWKLKGPTP
jgi:hypothetical protein